MRRSTLMLVAGLVLSLTPTAVHAATADLDHPEQLEPTLARRATLSADFIADGPPSGANATPANGRQGPFPGQVIPGFSGIVDNGDGTFWGLPDNGFGTKANSTDFLLRLYRIAPDWETADGGAGTIAVESFISLRDPDHHVSFPIVNEGTAERLLTGGDFDVESVDDPELKRRYIYEFDTTTGSYTGRRWQYRTDQDSNVIGDAVLVDDDRILLIERDDFEGSASVTKRLYVVDLASTDHDGFATKELVVDLLRIANPDHIGDGRPPGGYGLGDPFAFPLQSVETLAVLDDGQILVGNDNNYPGSNGRVPGTPDDTELIVLELRPRPPSPPGLDGPLVIGHRGASGYRPEHTLAAYELAITQCADYIEPDLVSTKDGVLVARHENEISGTTDVATRPEFADRRTTKVIDGVTVTGWFTEDFTLAELRTLRAVERIPSTRPQNTAFNGSYQIPTFEEVVDLAGHSRTCDGDPVGVYPETKHPTYFDAVGLSLEEELVRILDERGLRGQSAPVFIQSFEVSNLQELDRMTSVQLVQLINCSGRPYDFTAAGDPRTYADLVTPTGLTEIRRYADGIGACKDVLIPRDSAGNLATASPVIADAHRRGLVVHGWTFRRENRFLPTGFRSGPDLEAPGDLIGELRVFVDAGMDGFFTDNPDLGVAAVGDGT